MKKIILASLFLLATSAVAATLTAQLPVGKYSGFVSTFPMQQRGCDFNSARVEVTEISSGVYGLRWQEEDTFKGFNCSIHMRAEISSNKDGGVDVRGISSNVRATSATWQDGTLTIKGRVSGRGLAQYEVKFTFGENKNGAAVVRYDRRVSSGGYQQDVRGSLRAH